MGIIAAEERVVTTHGSSFWVSCMEGDHTSFGFNDPGLAQSLRNGQLAELGEDIHVRTRDIFGANVRVEVHDQRPPVQLDGWEEAVEVSVESEVGGEVLGVDEIGNGEHRLLLPVGLLRVRVHGYGRGGEMESPELDRYLLQVWIEDPSPAVTLL